MRSACTQEERLMMDRLALAMGVVGEAELTPSGIPKQVLEGDPRTAEKVLYEAPGIEVGIWEVTPGRFASKAVDICEVFHVVSGAGELRHHDGSVTNLTTGAFVVLPPGWSGTWSVTKTVRKSYVICDTAD